MESGLLPAAAEVNGINLDNYFLYNQDFNCSVYVHKKFWNSHGRRSNKQTRPKVECRKRDRAQECHTNLTDSKCPRSNGFGSHHDSVLKQTIKFAKNLIPITIPPSRDKSPVYYTIKTLKNSRKKGKKETSLEQDKTYDTEKSKTVTKAHRREKLRNHKESLSIRDSFSPSSTSNTLDDFNVNHSLSCTLSEVSEKKCVKEEINRNLKRNDTKKIIVSESFEAVATNKVSEGDKIKVHLMNETDKKMLIESIRLPVFDTIRNCFNEFDNNNEVKINVNMVQNCVMSNAQKLDAILEKLVSIEKILVAENEEKPILQKRSKGQVSTLERLGEDMEENEISGTEEELQYTTDFDSKNDVVEYIVKDQKTSNLGCGEDGTVKKSISVGVKTDNIGRLPTRFCWTDTVLKN